MNQCWNNKPRNRPSFSQILKHLEIVSTNEILLKMDEEYFKSQICWKNEIQEKMNVKQFDVSTIQLYNIEDDLIQKRKEELKHATDIRELYEQKLEKANNLYFELSTVLVQLDQRERELKRREKEFNINNENIVRPILKREFQDRTKSYLQTNPINNHHQQKTHHHQDDNTCNSKSQVNQVQVQTDLKQANAESTEKLDENKSNSSSTNDECNSNEDDSVEVTEAGTEENSNQNELNSINQQTISTILTKLDEKSKN